MNTTEILKKTEKLVNDSRAKTHGDKVANHENIARLWSSYLQNKTKLMIVLTPEDVAQLMTLLKIAGLVLEDQVEVEEVILTRHSL